MYNYDTILEMLVESFPFLSKMSEKDIKYLIDNSELIVREKGEIVAREEEKCTGTVLMLKGILRLYKISENGKEMTIYRVKKGEICVLTMYCILGNADYPLIAEVERKITYLHIPAVIIKELIFNNTVWQEYIFSTMSKRLAEMLVIIEEVAFGNMNTRLINYLTSRANESESNVIQTTHEKIAAELATDRVVISRLLKTFENKGILNLSRGKIIIQNPELLKENY
jgi:CRP/FNR family transcriptional regulator